VRRELEHNQRAWDERARRGDRHTKSVVPKHLLDPLPILDPENWLGGNVRGQRILCLASGGGLQSAMLASAGAIVTVVDISNAMLDQDRAVAGGHNLQILSVQTSMDDLSMFPDASFDIVLQPVSTCYVPDVTPVYREVARVLRDNGLYISQHKQPASLQAETLPTARGYIIIEPAERTGPLPPTLPCAHREADTLEYLHRWQSLIGTMCRSGFVIEDLVEPPSGANLLAEPGTFEHRSAFLPPYVKLKARRLPRTNSSPLVQLP
jgi:ubiquinone/menaquinone biosynthesis C-methylase UbiE